MTPPPTTDAKAHGLESHGTDCPCCGCWRDDDDDNGGRFGRWSPGVIKVQHPDGSTADRVPLSVRKGARAPRG